MEEIQLLYLLSEYSQADDDCISEMENGGGKEQMEWKEGGDERIWRDGGIFVYGRVWRGNSADKRGAFQVRREDVMAEKHGKRGQLSEFGLSLFPIRLDLYNPFKASNFPQPLSNSNFLVLPFPYPLYNPQTNPSQLLLSMFHKDQKFSYFDYQELTKDFCHNKPLSLHFQTQNKQTSFSFDQLIEVRSGKCCLADSFKLKHKIAENKLLKTQWGLNSMKVYYGYEIKGDGDNSSVLYSRLDSDRKLQNASVQFGVERKSSQLQFDANVTTFLYQRQNQYFLYGRLIYHGRRFNLGLLSVFDYSSKNLQTNNVVLQVKPHDKHQIFFRGEVDGLRNYSLKYSKLGNYFDYFILNYILKPSETLTLMAEVKYDLNTKRVKNMQSIIQKKFLSKKLKVGVNQNADVIFQMRFPLGIGLQSNFDFGMELADIFKSRKISYGFRVNINP